MLTKIIVYTFFIILAVEFARMAVRYADKMGAGKLKKDQNSHRKAVIMTSFVAFSMVSSLSVSLILSVYPIVQMI